MKTANPSSTPNKPRGDGQATRRRAVSLLVMGMLAGIASGCRDLAPVVAPASTAERLTVATAKSTPGGAPEAAQFQVSMHIHGSFRPGEPLAIEVRTSARVPSRAAVIRITVPDLALAELTNWETARVPVGTSLP